MTETRHTPGPWEYEWRSDEQHGDHVAFGCDAHPDDWFMLVKFAKCVDSSDWYGEGPVTEEIANARLIAAAPELLEACEGFMKEFCDHAQCPGGGDCDWDVAECWLVPIKRLIANVKGDPE